MSRAPSPGGTQAVDRAAALVDLVVRADAPPSFTELSDESGLARSTTSRLLAALERTGLLERDPAGGYLPGELFAVHALLHRPSHQIARLAHPVLAAVGAATGETVHLGVPYGHEVVHVAQVESTYLLSARDWNQVSVPVHCSALGKVLLAYECLPLPAGRLERRTARTVTDRAALVDELDRIRHGRVATTVDELETGLSAIAAPVEGRGGVFAALGVSGPTARLADRVEPIGRLLQEQAEALSERLRRTPGTGPDRSTRGSPAHHSSTHDRPTTPDPDVPTEVPSTDRSEEGAA